jgi:MerR family transcriptional regulator, redox-sensitive transcriptional activator SoxR
VASGHLSIGEFAQRAGVSVPTLRFYEERGLVHSTRTSGNQRRYLRAELRRVAFVKAAQQVGLTLTEIEQAMAALPDARVPTRSDWTRLSRTWRPRLDARIAELERLRDGLDGCIGCGCLSLKSCVLHNPGDRAGLTGSGARYIESEGPAQPRR